MMKHLPALSIAELLCDNFSRFDAKSIAYFLGQIWVGTPIENFYIWHLIEVNS
jgi:hypothetical protein